MPSFVDLFARIRRNARIAITVQTRTTKTIVICTSVIMRPLRQVLRVYFVQHNGIAEACAGKPSWHQILCGLLFSDRRFRRLRGGVKIHFASQNSLFNFYTFNDYRKPEKCVGNVANVSISCADGRAGDKGFGRCFSENLNKNKG